ncbi:MAG: sialate O-acetylesterase, partial [Planctomycetota bacterium]
APCTAPFMGAALGFALVPITADLPMEAGAVVEYRVVPLTGAFGKGTEWAAVTDGKYEGTTYSAKANVPAGGWYRLDIRSVVKEQTVAAGSVEPVGVGEVFVIAGQSYADGANDEMMKVEEPQGRVSTYSVAKKSWAIAHDPQPNSADGGTIWPPLGDLLVPLLRVPVGFVNVAVGGTSSRQWLPGENLYQKLAEAGTTTGRFRYVLWQQGESDVIENVNVETYVKNITKIREELAKHWGFEPKWLLAKSTLHPTVYNFPEREQTIRTAIDQLWTKPGFGPGPDTDILDGENRGGIPSRRHFSGIGQRRAALMWLTAIWPALNNEAGPTITPVAKPAR